jgi:hypothetical protein
MRHPFDVYSNCVFIIMIYLIVCCFSISGPSLAASCY